MTLDRRLRHVFVVASIVGSIGAFSERVDAHATFVGAPAVVVADTDIALTMNVPHERDDTTFNVGVAIRLPADWTGVACQNKQTWSCSIGVESSLVVIRFDKDPNAAPAEDESFGMTVHSGPTPGSASFPTLQTYSTGEVVAWIGPPGSSAPAPILQVTGAPPVTTQVAATPTIAPSTAAPASSTAEPAATTSPTTIALPPPTSLSATTTSATTLPKLSTSTTEAAASTTITVTAVSTSVELTSTPSTTDVSASTADRGSGQTAGIVAVALALVAAAAGAFVYVYVRRRRMPAPSHVGGKNDPGDPSATG